MKGIWKVLIGLTIIAIIYGYYMYKDEQNRAYYKAHPVERAIHNWNNK